MDSADKITKTNYALELIAAGVGLSGLITIGSILLAVVHLRHPRVVPTDAITTSLVGLSFVYLASLLRRGKRTAWAVTLGLYVFLLARNLRHFDFDITDREYPLRFAVLNIFLPSLVVLGLIIYWRLFNVRSEIRNFTVALRRSIVVLLVALAYGVIGFQLVDTRDFHQEIPLLTGVHYTIDQLGITTAHPPQPYTRRATVFLDSLAAVSLGSLFYVGLALFSPIRFRLNARDHDYADLANLLKQYPSTTEDFFKLWPPDKAYFFNAARNAVIAYKTNSGIALAVGDPVGKKSEFKNLLIDFYEYCRVNDWQPAFIHTEPVFNKLYSSLGFELQKIGEEALVNIGHFKQSVVTNKYFRNIINRFEKQHYTTAILEPPHSPEILSRLKVISDDWLQRPGRAERGFMLGYFSERYLNQCPVMVAKDANQTIQAFVNQVPGFNPLEANFDFIRHSHEAPGNINDFLMSSFIDHLSGQGFQRVNMGLSALSGIDSQAPENKDALDKLLGFVYESSGRFFSFQGLKRFKEKYEPEWEDRYIVYLGSWAGFAKTMNALLRAMRLPRQFSRPKPKNS